MTIYHLDEVYGVARDIPKNYVPRDAVDGELISALTRDQHIVIFGSSKQGKTCLRKYNLRDSEYLSVVCSNKWSLAQLHSAVLKAAGYVVEGTTTRAVSGENKIAAKLQAQVNLGFAKIGSELGGESGGTELVEREERQLELDPADVNDIIEALNVAEAPKFLVLEDFHYLPEDTQRDFAVALKAFHEASEYCFLVVGVWLDKNRLIQQNGDLTGRVMAINADAWSDAELREVVARGEELLKVRFAAQFVDELMRECFDSVWVVQESCRRVCEDAGVFQTQEIVRVVGEGVDASAIVREVVDQHSARYSGFLLNFSVGFMATELEMYKWLLLPVLLSSVEDLERGLLYRDLRNVINDRHPKAPINPGNITQALQSTASLQVGKQIKPIVLDYDQTNRRLNVVDRSFLIWLQHQDRSELLSELGLEDTAP